MLTGHGALRYGTSMWAVMWSCAAMAVDSTLSWLYRSQYVALVAPTSCFGVAVMSESEYMQKVPQEKLLLVIRATFFPKSAKQPNVCSLNVIALHENQHSYLRPLGQTWGHACGCHAHNESGAQHIQSAC